MKYYVACIQCLHIEADSEDEAAREQMHRQYRWCPDTIEVEPDEEE